MTIAALSMPLLRLELRRNPTRWMLPPIAAVFWFISFRASTAYPPLWNVRAMSMQTSVVTVFAPALVGAAAWMASREARRGMTDLVACTARPRWGRQLAVWAATTGWALAAYLGCVGVLYAVIARQAAWGGPLWWPAVVGAASLPAFAALGFAAGVLRPSRFTAPLVAIAAFLVLETSVQLIHWDQPYWQVSPLVAGPWEIGTDQGVATFYRYLPDLPIAQVTFLAGLTAALLGGLGLTAGAGGRWLRRSAAAVTVAGLLAAGVATGWAGTGRLDPHGMIAIPALHDPADDRPIGYAPVCRDTAIPVCLHPAYAGYLPAVADALEPVLREVAGLPGAPVRISQAAATYRSGPANEFGVGLAGPAMTGTPPVFQLLLPSQLPGPIRPRDDLVSTIRTDAGRDLVAVLVGADRDPSPAQQAVMAAILHTSTARLDPDTAVAAQRLTALPAAARHTWLAQHLAALRADRLTLEQLR